VYQGDAAGVVGVGMGVGFGGRAMGGPAGVGHAEVGGGERGSVQKGFFEDADAADAAAEVEIAAAVDDGDAGGIVAAVFQAFKAFDEQRLGDFSAYVGDDSAHKASGATLDFVG
jgi:hypothetical protein